MFKKSISIMLCTLVLCGLYPAACVSAEEDLYLKTEFISVEDPAVFGEYRHDAIELKDQFFGAAFRYTGQLPETINGMNVYYIRNEKEHNEQVSAFLNDPSGCLVYSYEYCMETMYYGMPQTPLVDPLHKYADTQWIARSPETLCVLMLRYYNAETEKPFDFSEQKQAFIDSPQFTYVGDARRISERFYDALSVTATCKNNAAAEALMQDPALADYQVFRHDNTLRIYSAVSTKVSDIWKSILATLENMPDVEKAEVEYQTTLDVCPDRCIYGIIAQNDAAFLKGDMDGIEDVTVRDALCTLMLAGSLSAGLTDAAAAEELAVADIDGDGEITVLDAQYILMYAANQSTGLPTAWEDLVHPAR